MGAPSTVQAGNAGAPIATFRDTGRVLATCAVPFIGLGFLITAATRGSHHGGGLTVAIVVFAIWAVLGIPLFIGSLRGSIRIYTDRVVAFPLALPYKTLTYPLQDLAGVGLYEVQHWVPGERGGERLTYEWQLVLWFTDGHASLLKSIVSNVHLHSSDLSQEFAHDDPILKAKAGRIAQAIYQQALAFQGATGPISKGTFPADVVEQSLGQPIARWTPYAGLKALGDNPDVQTYYPGAVPESPGAVARRKERRRHRRELSLLGVFVGLGFVALSLLSLAAPTTPDPAVAHWAHSTVNPDLARMRHDVTEWVATSGDPAASTRAAQACAQGAADAARINLDGPAAPLTASWTGLEVAYAAYFSTCTEVTAARSAAARQAAVSQLQARTADVARALQQLSTLASEYGVTVG